MLHAHDVGGSDRVVFTIPYASRKVLRSSSDTGIPSGVGFISWKWFAHKKRNTWKDQDDHLDRQMVQLAIHPLLAPRNAQYRCKSKRTELVSLE